MTLDVNAPALVLLNDQALPNTESFTYLGSVVRQDGGAKEDIQRRLSKSQDCLQESQCSLEIITVQPQD